MKDWKEFNELKDLGWKTKTQEEYAKWQADVKEWYRKQELTDWDKEQIKKQLEKINENKQAYFNKQQNKKQFTQKVTFLLQDDLAAALTKYIQLKTAVLASEYEGRLNIEKEKNFC